jgi:predicted secreted protein
MNSPRPYRMGFFAVWLLIGVIVAAFAVAHAKEAAAAPPAQAPEEVRLTLAQDGAVAELVSGQLLVLTLEANPSTGYLWQVDDLEPTAVRQVGVPEYVTEVSPISEDSDQLRVGAPAMAVLRFEAIAKGESTIRLAYRRPWEKGGAPLKTYSVRVRGLGEFGDVKPLPPLTPSPTVEARLKLDARGGRDLPAHFNWCEQGACTPIKDQGWCGSCWAFATVGPLESAIKIRDGVEKDLSEQYLVSCNTEGWNCQYGGSMAHDYHWWKVAQGELTAGARYETDFPYQAADVPCNAPHDAKEKLISWAMVVGANPVPTVGDLKEAIYEHGPVWAGVCVGNAFGNYTGGVFTTNENCGGGINHAIVLTGWDDSEGIWYLRNSWGEGWGENGTMRIAWGTSQVGYAANYVVYGGASACTPAETLACGQSLVGNNGGAGSTDVVDGYACTFGRNESGPEYVYSFTPDTAGYTKLSLSDLTADVDVFVLDAAAGDCGGGVCLKSGDNGVTFLAEAGRTYYVAVDGFEGAVGNYTITAQCGVGCGDAQEPNDAADQATAIAYGSSVNADICPAGDVDYYVFSGNAGDIIVADIDAWVNGSALDSYLTLYASDGVTEITANDDYDGLDSRIVYNLPSGGTYYLVVRELSHGSEGGPDYDYTLSLSVTPPPPDVISNWTSSAPTPDGYIQPGEWADAAAYDITVVRAKGERPRYAPGKEGGEVSTGRSLEALSGPRGEVRSEAVTLYVKNDATHLYLAIDNPNDTTVFEYDEMGVYFDDNPLPSDGRWTSLFCGNADGEGNFWVNPAGYWNGVAYREIIAGPDYCGIVDPAPGVSGVVGHASGHAQAELTIDLTSSALRAMPGDGIGMYLWILNSDTWMLEGQWPSVVQWDNPATYGQVRLATASPVCNEPLAPWLASPANGAGVADTTPDFDWADATHAAAYRIQVDDASDFATPVISATTTTSAFTPSTPLPPGTYYWRAQGWNNAGDCDVVGPWSTVRWLEIQPQVPNDDLGAAAVVAGLPFSRIQTTIGASLAADDPTLPCLGAWGFNSVWYRYTPPTTGQITFDTFGSSYDTVLAIWRGTRGNLTNVGCNDNSRGGLQSEVLATLQGGITYYVEIVGKTLTDQGDLSLSARSGDPAPGPACQTPTTPALATPADGATILDTTPNFDWGDASDATAYRIQVADTSNFATLVISATTTASAFTPSTPLLPGLYYWRAQGWNNVGGCDLVGLWSAARSLRIKSSLYLPVVIKR